MSDEDDWILWLVGLLVVGIINYFLLYFIIVPDYTSETYDQMMALSLSGIPLVYMYLFSWFLVWALGPSKEVKISKRDLPQHYNEVIKELLKLIRKREKEFVNFKNQLDRDIRTVEKRSQLDKTLKQDTWYDKNNLFITR